MVACLTFDSVEARAEGRLIFGPVSLRLASPGITVILGANGSGKSLFLALAHGILSPHKGVVQWDGRTATSSRADRGFVFQNTPVLRRSVAGNIALPLAARKLSRVQKDALLSKALITAKLGADARKPAATLSGGERQRLALARAMVTEPSVLFLDEPAANLDPAFTAELEHSLKSIAESGTKILMATHDLPQARRLASDILFFDGGQLTEQEAASKFFADPASTAAQNFLQGRL